MKRFALPLLMTLSAAACAAMSGGPAPTASMLIGSEWLLVEGQADGAADRFRATLAFPEPGRVAGSGGCNRFGAAADFEGRTVSIRQLVATRRVCPPQVMAHEIRYLAALGAAERIAIEGEMLLLFTKNAAQPLRFARIR
jgi:heat shock protein HslJ